MHSLLHYSMLHVEYNAYFTKLILSSTALPKNLLVTYTLTTARNEFTNRTHSRIHCTTPCVEHTHHCTKRILKSNTTHYCTKRILESNTLTDPLHHPLYQIHSLLHKTNPQIKWGSLLHDVNLFIECIHYSSKLIFIKYTHYSTKLSFIKYTHYSTKLTFIGYTHYSTELIFSGVRLVFVGIGVRLYICIYKDVFTHIYVYKHIHI